MSDALAFVEHPEQVRFVPEDHRIVCLTPDAQVQLEVDGRQFSLPEDHLSERDLEEAGVAKFVDVARFCRVVDDEICRILPEVQKTGLRPTWCDFFRLKILHDAYFLRAYEVSRILAATGPRQILCFSGPGWTAQDGWYSEDESLYAAAIQAVGQHLGLRTEVLSGGDSRRDRSEELTDRWYRRGRLTWKAWLRRRRRALTDAARVISNNSRDGDAYLCLDYAYDVPFIATELIRAGKAVWVWDGKSQPCRLGSIRKGARRWQQHLYGRVMEPMELRALDGITDIPAVREIWAWEDVSFLSLVKPRMMSFFSIILPALMSVAAEANDVIDRLAPKMIISSTLALAPNRAIAQVARNRGIPVVVSHHGALGTAYAPIHFYQDIDHCDGMLCYGEAVAAYPGRHGRDRVATTVVGSSGIEALATVAPSRVSVRRFLRVDRARPVVAYAPTNLQGNSRYLSYRAPSDRTCFRVHRRIIEVLASHPAYQIVVKDHPTGGWPSLGRWIRQKGWDHVDLIKSPHFRDLVNLADAVVIDLASTVLLEALQTDCRIYLYNDWLKWEPGILDAMRKVTTYYDDLDAFCARLGRDLESGEAIQPRLLPDESFLDLCCKPKRQRSSAELAAACLLRPLKDGCLDWTPPTAVTIE
jgi:hypothetical protein